jgi:hypothetical protein
MWDGTKSYPYLITNRYVHSSVPGLRLVDMSCSAETTESMVSGSTCAPGGSQYDNALAFLHSYKGRIALITIGIGGNDVVGCTSRPDAESCFVGGLKSMESNLSAILAGLRGAAGNGVPIVGMNVFDPLLGDWLASGQGRSIATAAAAGLRLLSQTMGRAYAGASMPMADVLGAFRSSDLTDLVNSRWGRVPIAVVRACTLLDIVCHRGSFIGFGDDPNDAGAMVIAHAFERVIGHLDSAQTR